MLKIVIKNTLLCLASSVVLFAQNQPVEKQKLQIEIEDELEEAGTTKKTEKETEDIVVSGEDEQLIRTFKSDTTFVSPSDASAMRWLKDKNTLDKDGKKKHKTSEKNGIIIPAYGMYDNSFINLQIAKSDKFGLYQLKYARENVVSEGYNEKLIDNSARSSDNVNVVVGSRILPNYLMMFDARYQGDNTGFQENPVFRSMFRRWANFSLQNNIKPDNKQVLNIDMKGNYLQSKYESTGLPDTTALYLDGALNAHWAYMFDNKITLEAKTGFDYASLTDIDQIQSMGASLSGELGAYFPIIKTFLGARKNIPWQLNINAGGGGFYKDTSTAQPTAHLSIDSKLDFWKSKLGGEKTVENFKTETAHLSSYYEKPVYYKDPLDFWHIFWDNGFQINDENTLKVKAGYKDYSVYFNPVMDSHNFYYRTPVTYSEIYGNFNWEFSFLTSFLLETALEINYGLTQVNMKPSIAFLVVLNYNTERIDAALSFRGIGQRQLDSISIKDYYLLGFDFRFWLNPTFALMAMGENLLNQDYMVYYPYRTSGIKLFAGCYIKF